MKIHELIFLKFSKLCRSKTNQDMCWHETKAMKLTVPNYHNMNEAHWLIWHLHFPVDIEFWKVPVCRRNLRRWLYSPVNIVLYRHTLRAHVPGESAIIVGVYMRVGAKKCVRTESMLLSWFHEYVQIVCFSLSHL